jgi:hypothetical protein
MLDQHADDSNDRIIGRMTSMLKYEVMDVPKVGKNVPCAVSDITFLGDETVKKVADGRIYHLSIGIDEKTDTLGETSAVIEPAAPGAMLLSARKKPKKEKEMPASKRLERMQRSAKRLATLGKIGEDLTKLTSDLKGSADLVRMTRREGEVTHRLSALMKAGKMTPAECKKMDIKRLAKLADDSLDTVLTSFEVREPVIDPHQRGSRSAEEFSTMGKRMEKRQLRALEKETVADLMRVSGGRVKLKAGSHLEAEDEDHGKDHEMGRHHASGPKETHENPGKDEHAVEGEEGDAKMKKFKGHMSKCKEHMEKGEFDDAKKEMAAMSSMSEGDGKHLAFGAGDVKSEDYKKGMDSMEAKVDELSTNLARLAGAVSEMMESEKEEGHELAADDDDQKPPKKEELE